VKRKFNEILVLDTNIILNDVENIITLSDNGNNLIVLPETVLDELDSKKSGFDEINFQAREFGRIFETAEVLDVDRTGKHRIVTSTHFIKNEINVYIDVISKTKYNSDNDTTIAPNIRNDRKIIEVARDLTIDDRKQKVVFLSLDTMCRHRALSLDVKVRSLKLTEDLQRPLVFELNVDELKDSYTSFEIESMDIPKSVQHIIVRDKNGKPQFYYKSGNLFVQIIERNLSRQEITPNNSGQRALSSMMLDEYWNLVISDSPAGSGKTLIAVSAAMRLMDKHKDKYDKIVYIRKTVISDSEELGFLKGDLKDKMSGYLAPLFSNLEYIVEKKYNNKKSKLTKEELDAKLDEIVQKYQIQSKYQGHLRGDTIRNAVVILDEFQNDTISSAKTILTRIGENCKVFVLGSTKQIDSKFLNKHNNALTFLINKIGEDNMNVNVTGCNLDKTVRSAIAEWADEFKT
jgi:PhoH-like ATPase